MQEISHKLASLLFGQSHASALDAWGGDRDDLARYIFAHPLTENADVARHRLDTVITDQDVEFLRTFFPTELPGAGEGRCVHGLLADYAEVTPDCDGSQHFLAMFERQALIERPDTLWSRMTSEGGAIRRFATFRHHPSGRELPLRINFDRPTSAEHVRNELAEFSIDEHGVTCHLMSSLPGVYATRLSATLPFIMPYLEHSPLSGRFGLSLGDEGLVGRVLSFSSQVPDFLVPDIMFVASRGYAAERETYSHTKPWHERHDRAYWRGTDTGVFRYRNAMEAPRVVISKMSVHHPDLIDARLTSVEPRQDWEIKLNLYQQEGLMGQPEDQARILEYKYQIDVDGNTNSWSGLFLKLLTGSPVLKLESELGFRQWYYSSLIPWENYVPVKGDGSDLMEKILWLRSNPDEALEIGRNGRDLALSITYESAIDGAVNTLRKLIHINSRMLD